jgi:hypothetical protein
LSQGVDFGDGGRMLFRDTLQVSAHFDALAAFVVDLLSQGVDFGDGGRMLLGFSGQQVARSGVGNFLLEEPFAQSRENGRIYAVSRDAFGGQAEHGRKRREIESVARREVFGVVQRCGVEIFRLNVERRTNEDRKEQWLLELGFNQRFVDVTAIRDGIDEEGAYMQGGAEIAPFEWNVDAAVVEIAERRVIGAGDDCGVQRAGENEIGRGNVVDNCKQGFVRFSDRGAHDQVGAG